MFNLTQSIELSALFVAAVLAIVMMGLLIVEMLKKVNKKQILFVICIYLFVLVRIGADIYFLYFSKSILNFLFASNILLVIPMLFFYVNRKKVDLIWLYLFSVCWIIFAVFNIMSWLVTPMLIIYHIYLVLLAFYNIILYLLVLNFLANSHNDD